MIWFAIFGIAIVVSAIILDKIYSRKVEITREVLIDIAKAGFPKYIQEMDNLDEMEFMIWGGVYRLYKKDTPFVSILPKESYFYLTLSEDRKYVHLSAGIKAFNHATAIKRMNQLKIIK